MNASDLCAKAILQEWDYYGSYSTLVYPFNNNVIHALGVGLHPSSFIVAIHPSAFILHPL